MRCRTFSLIAGLVLGVFVLAVGQTSAQNPKPDTVTIETVDGVHLKATYWGSTRREDAPTALLLHKIGSKSSDDSWKELADELQALGFAVLSFDFRGHGGSVTIDPKFWDFMYNKQLINRRPGVMAPTTISSNDFQARYWPYLVNDIAAAKRYLERRSDKGDCNAGNLLLVGAEDGATLGALWLASESKRYKHTQLAGKSDRPESRDVMACLWLSMSQNLGPSTPTPRSLSVSGLLPGWIREAGNTKDSRVPMAFIYGKEDKVGDAQSLKFVQLLKPMYKRGTAPVDTDPLKATGDYGVPGAKLQGAKLLTKELATRNWILTKYLTSVVLNDQKKGPRDWENRKPDEAIYIWSYGRGIPCNFVDGRPGAGKVPFPVPLQSLGLR